MASSKKFQALLKNAVESEVGDFQEVAEMSEEEKALWEIFEEKPVPLTEFIQGEDFLNIPDLVLSEPQYDMIRHFEQIYYVETYELMAKAWDEYWTPVRMVNTIVAAIGKAGGKDLCIQVAFARIAYLLLCLKSPQRYYKSPEFTPIHMMNVATAAPQAQDVFFTPLLRLFRNSKWFEDKFAPGIPMPGPRAGAIHLVKNVELISGHSQAESLEGKNLIAAVADEIDAFPTEDSGGDKTRTASYIVNMLQTSSVTRFPRTYKVGLISFARSKGGFILTSLREARENVEELGEKSNFYPCGPYASWDFNPKFRRDFEFIKIPQTDVEVPNSPGIIAMYRSKPGKAKGYYECKPEDSEDAFFKDRKKVEACFSKPVPVPPLKVNYYFGVDDEEKYPSWQVDFEFGPQLIPVPGAIYTIHADMALKDDRAGIAMCHVSHYNEVETLTSDGSSRTEYRPVVVVDFISTFDYDSAAEDPEGNSVPREIQVRWYRKLILALSDLGFTFGSVSQDGWMSVDSLQILQAWGYEAHKLSTDVVSTPCWNTLRDLMYDNRLEGYEHKPLVQEILGLEKTKRGKIDHPASGSKDLADAVAAAATMAVECGGQEEVAENTSNSRFFNDDSFGSFGSFGSEEFDSFSGEFDKGFSRTGDGLW